jgi:vitamin B12/bleomycin/antimicrobial peptide transport system ATP-binding/permease protein
LDIASEAKMYILLRNMAQKTFNGTKTGGTSTTGTRSSLIPQAGLTYISVGHRPSLINFHDIKLRLAGDGTNHEMITIDKASSSISSTFQTIQESQFNL